MLTALDVGVIAIYIIGVFVLAVLASRGKGLDSFFVNSRATRLPILILSVVATTIGAGFFVTVVAETYESGISFALSIMAVVAVTATVLAIIAPRIKRLADEGAAYTVPELLEQRYGDSRVGMLAGVVIVVGYLFITALQFVGIGAVASVAGRMEFSHVLLVAGLFTVGYTAIGGLRSNFYADAVSFVAIVAGLVVLIPILIMQEGSEIVGLPRHYFDPFAFAGPSFFVLSILISIVSAFIFLELWQRIFAAESIKTARRAFIWSAVLQPVFVAAACVIGLGAAANYTGIEKSEAIFLVIRDYLPPGLAGLGTVALIAILMTTINSLVVVGGSTIYVDLLRLRKSKPQVRDTMRAPRIATAGFGLAAMGVAYLLPDLVRLLLMGAFIMLPLCPAIIWGVFASRPSPRAAVWSVSLGMAVTLALLPIMPNTAFGPGLLVSFATMWGIQSRENRQPRRHYD